MDVITLGENRLYAYSPTEKASVYFLMGFEIEKERELADLLGEKGNAYICSTTKLDLEVLNLFSAENCPYPTNSNKRHLVCSSFALQEGVVVVAAANRTFASLTIIASSMVYSNFYPLFPEVPIFMVVSNEEVEKTYRLSFFRLGVKVSFVKLSALPCLLEDVEKGQQLSWRKLADGFWEFSLGIIDCFYLLERTNCAFLIDTGSPRKDGILKEVRALTDKKIILLVTHGHADHFGNLNEFENIYFPEDDKQLLVDFFPCLSKKVTFIKGNTTLKFEEDQVEVVDLKGHTGGSVGFYFKDRGYMFTGDAFGSGDVVLVTHSYASSISEYKKTLKVFLDKYGNEELIYFGGHTIQETKAGALGASYNPLDLTYVKDMYSLTELLLSPDNGLILKRNPSCDFFANDKTYRVDYKKAGIILTKAKIC